MLKQSMQKEQQRLQRKQGKRAKESAAALEAVTQYGKAPCNRGAVVWHLAQCSPQRGPANTLEMLTGCRECLCAGAVLLQPTVCCPHPLSCSCA
jgi:hypothetical protein